MNTVSKKLLVISLILSLIVLVVLTVLFIDKYVKAKETIDNVEDIPEEKDIQDNDTTVDTVVDTPIIIEEPEPPYQIYEKEGVTYLLLEGTEIIFVNKVYSVPSSFGGLNSEAETALSEMIAAAEADNITLFLMSGYRSYETQDSIYSRYVSEWGQEYTDTVSARPGHSEHQTGLAFDLNSLSNSFKETTEYEWLQTHCMEYGFIMRYLEGSEWATGYSFEPWHYRYIGDTNLARKIMESGLSLEEYIGLTDVGEYIE